MEYSCPPHLMITDIDMPQCRLCIYIQLMLGVQTFVHTFIPSNSKTNMHLAERLKKGVRIQTLQLTVVLRIQKASIDSNFHALCLN